jgi:nicotinate-nucleotide pyrophosphorylase (carboxylating)
VLCGTAWFDEVFRQLDSNISITWQTGDGERVAPDQTLCTLEGPAHPLLSGERTALNFLQSLSGTATVARQYADIIEGIPTRILDTRKTIPGLRTAQKYSVHCGGCYNHRVGLYDGILIKENHISAAGSINKAIEQAKKQGLPLAIEIEVENLNELEQALQAGADIVLLDNFSHDLLIQAVSQTGGRAKLEASGNITTENLRAAAETGVDYISIGALTKHLHAIDLSMRIQTTENKGLE